MKRFIWSFAAISLCSICFGGCGGHEGGVIDVAPDQNPYQISAQEQKQMDSAADPYRGMTEEEITAMKEAEANAAAIPVQEPAPVETDFPTQPTVTPNQP